ncbi:MAG: hypothetical protein NWE93_08145 [Candidatus Bathyarchaeota archaeon]|nr:hypothetical protein [Candidatus Bathyarchaeota archaeon]
MKTRETLRNRIRGWFPQEPKIKNSTFAISDSLPKMQAIPPQRYKAFSLNRDSIFFILLLGMPLLNCLFYLPFSNFVGLILFGAVIGTFLAIVPAYRELQTLFKTGSSNVKLSTTTFIVFALSGLCLIIGNWIVNFPQVATLTYSMMAFFVSSLLSAGAAQTLLFRAWERKNKSELWRGEIKSGDFWRGRFVLYSIPKTRTEQNEQKSRLKP